MDRRGPGAGFRRCGGLGRWCLSGGCRTVPGIAAAGAVTTDLNLGNRCALGHLVAGLDQHLGDGTVHRTGHLHGRLVALQGDDRVLGGDRVARPHQHLNDVHRIEVADVGDGDFLDLCHANSSCAVPRR
ncbi:hypothetical protein SPICUR_00215 [Spiribacter curvatus]|uniref:Uncharacterized protein n=1 Tax=Spiribacter curvatus TaxID=1335757 RepID=U5T4H6_9GAMM|nr:hypothetical protein SPICUR_00215 [Spiribacter curvatus]